MENEVLTLAKPRKSGLIHLIFSRFFVIVILLAVQIAMVITIYVKLYQYLLL